MFTPTSPPRLLIEPLPTYTTHAAARTFLDGNGTRAVEVFAWLPDRWAELESAVDSNSQDFEQDTCRNCDYYRSERHLDSSDLDEEYWQDAEGTNWQYTSATVASPCPCYEDGLESVDWPCAAGYTGPTSSSDSSINAGDTFDAGPMRFSARRYLTANKLFQLLPWRHDFTALLQAIKIKDGIAYVTTARKCSNTYEPDHAICFGDNSKPQTMAEAVAIYGDAPCNNDLLPLDEFIHNIELTRSDRLVHECHFNVIPAAPQLQQGLLEALLVADATTTTQAFCLLAASGAPVDGQLATLLVSWQTVQLPDGSTTEGWLSQPLAGNHCWLIAQEADSPFGVLLGQIPATNSSPCTSNAPSSSAPAALAAI